MLCCAKTDLSAFRVCCNPRIWASTCAAATPSCRFASCTGAQPSHVLSGFPCTSGVPRAALLDGDAPALPLPFGSACASEESRGEAGSRWSIRRNLAFSSVSALTLCSRLARCSALRCRNARWVWSARVGSSAKLGRRPRPIVSCVYVDPLACSGYRGVHV